MTTIHVDRWIYADETIDDKLSRPPPANPLRSQLASRPRRADVEPLPVASFITRVESQMKSAARYLATPPPLFPLERPRREHERRESSDESWEGVG
jgi:hypothetical protein